MGPRVRVLAVAGAVALSVTAGTSSIWADAAQDAARNAFATALAAAKKGDHEGAAKAFDQSEATIAHPKTLIASSLEWERAGRFDRAADRLVTLLARDDVGRADRDEQEKRLASLDTKVAIAHIRGPSGATVDIDGTKRPVPTTARLLPGHFSLHATTADGHTPTLEGDATPGKEINVDVPAPAATAPTSSGPIAPPPASSAAPPPPPPTEQAGTWRKPVGIGLIAGGVALAGTGAVFGLLGVSAKNTFEKNRSDAKDHDDAARDKVIANVGFISGAVVGAVGIYFVVSAPSANAASVGFDGQKLNFRGSF